MPGSVFQNLILYVISRRTLVWQGTKFAFLSLSCYRFLDDGNTDRRGILHDGTY